MNEAFDFTIVDSIVDELGCKQSAIIAILQCIQEHYRYLPKEVFPYLSKKLGSVRQEYTARQLSMRIFLWNRRENS